MQVANQWLENAKTLVCAEVFKLPELAAQCHFSYGFPSSRALTETKALGETWQQNGKEAIFINPWLFQSDKLSDLLATLVHELIHVKIGVEAKHGKLFKKEMKIVGLTGKATSTYPTIELAQQLLNLPLGPLPELHLEKVNTKKQTTRLILLKCVCGRKIRMAKKVIEEGPIICGKCQEKFKTEEELLEVKGD